MDKIEKANGRLSVHDYFAARELYKESVRKIPAPAFYGLSKIYMRNNNPFFNLDSARQFILQSDSAFSRLDEKDRRRCIERYGLDSLVIRQQMDSVAFLAWSSALAQSSGKLDAFNRFIALYPFSKQLPEARQYRDSMAYSLARQANTSASYQEFLTAYPSAKQVQEARQHYDERIFFEETRAGNAASYEAYLQKHPNNSYRVQAEDSLFAVLTRSRSSADYYAFAKSHPGNRNTPEAWMKLYHRYLEENGADNFRQFMADYPDFPYLRRVTDDFKLYNTVLLPVRNGNKWGFITSEGKPAVPVEYDDLDRFSEGLCAASKNGRYGFINKAGRAEIDFQYEEAEAFENGTALVRKNGKAMLISRDNESLMQELHDDVGTPHEDRISFLDGDRYGYADEKGKVVIPARFETAGDFRNGMAIAGSDDSIGLIDRFGQWIIPPQFEFIEMEENGLLRVMKDGLFGIYNRFGEAVLPVVYDAVGRYSCHLALVAKNQKSGYADDSATLAIPMIYDFNSERFTESAFHEGYAVVFSRKKAGLIDSLGSIVLPAVYEDLRFAGDTLPVAVRKKGKWGYVNLDNKTVVDFRYEDAQPFHNDLAVVKQKGKSGIVDLTGKMRLPAEYQALHLYDDAIEIRKTGTGLLSRNFAPLVAPEFDACTLAVPGIYKFERQKKFGYYNVARKEWIWKEEGL